MDNGQIQQDGQRVDVGFLKLFLSTKPLNLSDMEQRSPFLPPYKVGYRGGTKQPFEAIGSWSTTIVTLVQRPGNSEGSSSVDVEMTK